MREFSGLKASAWTKGTEMVGNKGAYGHVYENKVCSYGSLFDLAVRNYAQASFSAPPIAISIRGITQEIVENKGQA